MTTPSSPKAGHLTILGSGITCISQLTIQALSYIENADVVCYLLTDSATEAYIRKKNKNCHDLYQFYDEKKRRMDTYILMAEYMLNFVRKGQNVVGVLYGHPGVFVTPSHRAIAIARSEGHKAVMLPGISAEDCLFADLSVDPASVGCLTYEATDLLVSKRPLIPTSHLVLFQVGVVGEEGFRYGGFQNNHLDVLLDRLQSEYGANHSVTHYIGALLPHEPPVIEQFTITQLRRQEIKERIVPHSTFYVPPKHLATKDVAVCEILGIDLKASAGDHIYPFSPQSIPYGPHEKQLVSQLQSVTPGDGYRRMNESSALIGVVESIILDPRTLAQYLDNPRRFADSKPTLTHPEREALANAKTPILLSALKDGFTGTSMDIVAIMACCVAGG